MFYVAAWKFIAYQEITDLQSTTKQPYDRRFFCLIAITQMQIQNVNWWVTWRSLRKAVGWLAESYEKKRSCQKRSNAFEADEKNKALSVLVQRCRCRKVEAVCELGSAVAFARTHRGINCLCSHHRRTVHAGPHTLLLPVGYSQCYGDIKLR